MSKHRALPETLRPYANQMNQADFDESVQELYGMASSAVTVMLCAEQDYRRCHRALLSDKLLLMGARVTHIIDENHVAEHALHPDLELIDGEIRYTPHQLSLL